jgi:hypothetical protein
MMLSNEHSENLIEIFKSSLDSNLEASDQIALLEAGTVEEFIAAINKIQLTYLKKHKAAEPEVQITKTADIPFTDCIQTHIDTTSGELNGFTMRP